MKINDVKIKDEITLNDKFNAIKYIVSSCFDENDNGDLIYTPYYSEIAKFTAITKFFLDGIELEDDDIFEEIIENSKVKPLLLRFFSDISENSENINDENFEYISIFNVVMSHVADMVEYKKQENIAKIQSESNSVLTYKMLELLDKENERLQKEIDTTSKLEEYLNVQNEINSSLSPDAIKKFVENMNSDDIVDNIIDKFSGSKLYETNKELIEAHKVIREKENKIIELQTDFAKEQQKHNVRNVISD